MDKPWFRKIFGGSTPPSDPNTEATADAGNPDAQFHLAMKFANGDGQSQDYAKAAQWYLKAASQNHALAQFNLGVMFTKGQGVAQDEAEAGRWFGQAAQQGDAGAQYQLGMNHYCASIRGLAGDAPESRIEAYKWFSMAAAQGYLGSDDIRPVLVANMSNADVTEANHRAAMSTAESRNLPGPKL